MHDEQRKRAKKTLPPPEWMNEEATEVWKKLSKHLTRTGKLTKENSHLLEIYCVTYCQWRKIAEVLMNSSVILFKKDEYGRAVDCKTAPLLYPFEQYGRTLCKYARDLGLTEAPKTQGEADAGTAGDSDLWSDEQFQRMLKEVDEATGQEVRDADGQ